MSLQHILLGCLARPASGYDLQKEIDLSFSHFWSVSLPQIYPALRRMEEERLVESALEKSTAGPPRRVYRRTKAGKAALVDWLREGPIFGGERRHYLAQVYFLDALADPAEAIDFLRDLQAIMAARLEALNEVESDWRDEMGADFPDRMPDREFFPHLAFDLGHEIAQVYADWCARSIKRLEERAKGRKGSARN